MNTVFLLIVVFLCVLAVFDLVVGVSNDAVNFLNSAIGAKVAKFKTILLIAAVGVFAGAAMSNGMMDVARHGIMTPEYFSFYEVICIFLGVMVTDVILLDIFNTLGMPTSTTVSMVFELLGGAFALAIVKIASGDTMPDGALLGLGDLLNTEKAISVILGIFLSVAIAFAVGAVVMWISRLVFTFTYRVNGRSTAYNGKQGGLTSSSIKIGIFGGIATTSIIWFLLINGLKGSSFMSPEIKEFINANTWLILGGGMVVFSLIMTAMSALKLPVLKFVVLLGTFALAMAFAGNDLVNFVGVPLTGLEAYQDYAANGAGNPDTFLMGSLMGSAHTPVIFLVIAGVVMVLSLIFSKKAQNVVKTSISLSRHNEGDEMFGSSPVARTLVRHSNATGKFMGKILPKRWGAWVDSRYNSDEMALPQGAAFDMIRAAVNLVFAGLLVAMGTSMKLPLSTTYVTFMVAMGTSLADRAWSRESAVFRITGVLSVIGGWFITAGAAFICCFALSLIMYYGGFAAMLVAIALTVYLLLRSSFKSSKKDERKEENFYSQIAACNDKEEIWNKLCEHIKHGNTRRLEFIASTYGKMTDAFLHEQYQPLKRSASLIEDERKALKRQRKGDIMTMQRLDPEMIMTRNTWYFMTINSCQQMLYSLKRLNEPLREHVGNSFSPLPVSCHNSINDIKEAVIELYKQALEAVKSNDMTHADQLRNDSTALQRRISDERKAVIDMMQHSESNLSTLLLTVHILQESQELTATLRHMLRGLKKFTTME